MSLSAEHLERVLTEAERQEAQEVSALLKKESIDLLQGRDESPRRDTENNPLFLRGPKTLEGIFAGGELEICRSFGGWFPAAQVSTFDEYKYVLYPDRVLLAIYSSTTSHVGLNGFYIIPGLTHRREVDANELAELREIVINSTEFHHPSPKIKYLIPPLLKQKHPFRR